MSSKRDDTEDRPLVESLRIHFEDNKPDSPEEDGGNVLDGKVLEIKKERVKPKFVSDKDEDLSEEVMIITDED